MFLTFVSVVVFYFSILQSYKDTHRKKARGKDRHRKTKEATEKEKKDRNVD